MAKKTPKFLFELCVNCSICVQACPVSCIELSAIGIDKFRNLYPEVDKNKCIGCSICMKNCPMDAVVMEEEA